MNTAAVLSTKLLTSALRQQASDIHLVPGKDHTEIFFRIQGKRLYHTSITKEQYQILLTYFKFSSGMDIGEIRKPQNGTMFHDQDGYSYSLRFSTLPFKESESLAIRILPQREGFSFSRLFLFPHQGEKLKNWMANRSGIILVTGPTGSGKTTSLYTLLEEIISNKDRQIITLEDPVEKDLDGILQVQLNKKAGITYQSGLKAALRHDPDILMVGEIRDEATAKFAFDASLTGHLVLSTLHAKHASGTLYRLLEMGIKRSDIHQSLIGVAAITLLPIIAGNKRSRRAAIMELLESKQIESLLEHGIGKDLQRKETFEYLRKKAFAYGFIDEQTAAET